MESWVQRWQPRTNAATNNWCQVIRSAAPVTQNHLRILANLQIWCSKMQPLSGNQRPDLLTSLMNMSFVLQLPQKMHLCRSSSNVPRLPSFLEMPQNPHVLLTFEKVHNPLRLPRETRSHLNFQKWSEHGVFCTFWLRNVLRATTACTFSTSQLPKVVRPWCALYILTSKCASRHNGVHFFDIATSKSGLNVRCFFPFSLTHVLRTATACTSSSLIWPDGSAPAALASLLFDPPEPQIIGKTQCFATFLPFRAPVSSYFWLFRFSDLLSSALLFSLPLPISAFHLPILSEVWLLNFLRTYKIS